MSNKDGKLDQQIDRFFNKEHNFSITWYPALPSLFNQTLEKSIQSIEEQKQATKKDQKRKPVK